ncbi:MAG TPA: hypothetical protein VFE41_15620 [Acetobacteraceae bacterium]|jgi:hypothetical protein|nr:hypothetical protein [Acetobacteraceae bacterium]
MPDWGVAISRIDGDGKTDPAEVTKMLDAFRTGKLDFDGMLKKLNAKLSGPAKTGADKDGVATVYLDCNFVTGVSVAVNRVGGGWEVCCDVPASWRRFLRPSAQNTPSPSAPALNRQASWTDTQSVFTGAPGSAIKLACPLAAVLAAASAPSYRDQS